MLCDHAVLLMSAVLKAFKDHHTSICTVATSNPISSEKVLITADSILLCQLQALHNL